MFDDKSEDIVPYENKSFDELIEEAKNVWKQTTVGLYKLKRLLPVIFEKGRRAGISDEDIRRRITGELGVPYTTMLRYIPEDAKRKYERYHDEKSSKVEELPPNQARLQSEKEYTSKDLPVEAPVIEPELIHRTMRITMSRKMLYLLGTDMIKWHTKYPEENAVYIEYDFVDEALYIDALENGEKGKKLMVKDA